MSTLELFSIAWKSVRSNKMRSILTMLGIIIGVAAVVALMGLGQGAQNSITSQLTSNGTNLLTISPGSFNQGGVRSAAGSAQTLTQEDATAIAQSCTVCTDVAPEYSGASATIVYGSQNTNTRVLGVTTDYQAVRNLVVSSGAWFATTDINAARNVAVIGSSTADTLFQGDDPVGESIRINSLAFTVVGVLQTKGGTGFTNPDNAVYVPLTTAQRKLLGQRQAAIAGHNVSAIYVQVDNADDMTTAQNQITDLLSQRHHLTGTTTDFSITNQADLLNSLNNIIGTLTLFLGAIAGISLLVGGIGIMNIMLVSVTERTREIGIRKAVGAQEGDILRQFLVEAVTVSVGGGILGLALGYLIAEGISMAGIFQAAVSPTAALLALGFSVAVGLFFGIYPARRAARLDPIDALRTE